MSDYKVEMDEDSMSSFRVEFSGPKDSASTFPSKGLLTSCPHFSALAVFSVAII